MTLKVQEWPRPEWSPLPREGCVGVEGRVLLVTPRLALAMLRFARNATIDKHAAEFPVDVVCLEGSGSASVGESTAPLRAGQRIHWPAGEEHRLWTDDDTMITLMVEHHERGVG